MLLFHEFEGTGYFSQVNEHSSGRVKKPDNGLATAIYLHLYMHVLCMYFVVLYFIDLPNKQTNKQTNWPAKSSLPTQRTHVIVPCEYGDDCRAVALSEGNLILY